MFKYIFSQKKKKKKKKKRREKFKYSYLFCTQNSQHVKKARGVCILCFFFFLSWRPN